MSRQSSPNSLKSLVKNALKSARMENACFEEIFPKTPLPRTEEEVNAFIKNRIEIYMSSWVIKPLEAVVEKLEKKKNVNI
jgi:hypothetical protein